MDAGKFRIFHSFSGRFCEHSLERQHEGKRSGSSYEADSSGSLRKGIIEQVIPEPENLTPESMWQVTEELDNRIDDFLKKYDSLSEEELLEHRYTRFRRF